MNEIGKIQFVLGYKQGQLDELNRLMKTKDKNKAVALEDIIINRIKYLEEEENG